MSSTSLTPKQRLEPASFASLPESIRNKIWTNVAFWPRIVSICEKHELSESWDVHDDLPSEAKRSMPSWFLKKDEIVESTMHCRTRPPAILSVCRESRGVALTVYRDISKEIPGPEESEEETQPIYVNSTVDIILRGEEPCAIGDSFRVRYSTEDKVSTVPVAFTETLAIDLTAVTKDALETVPSVHLAALRWGLFADVKDRSPSCEAALARHPMLFSPRQDKFAQHHRLPADVLAEVFVLYAKEIAECAEGGVRQIYIVVDNDGDLPEVEFVPYREPTTGHSLRDVRAIRSTRNLRKAIDDHWRTHAEDMENGLHSIPQPKVSLMSVKRKPLENFTLFPKLPLEIQDMVWTLACQIPTVYTLSCKGKYDLPSYESYAPPSIARACHAAYKAHKAVVWKKSAGRTFDFKPEIDVARIPLAAYGSFKEYSKSGVTSIGIHWDGPWRTTFSGSDAKLFPNLKEVVVLVGRPRETSELCLEAIADEHPNTADDLAWMDWDQLADVRRFTLRLVVDIQRTLKKWKTYQRSRIKKGKSSPDWYPPTVRMAWLRDASSIVDPYERKVDDYKELENLRRDPAAAFTFSGFHPAILALTMRYTAIAGAVTP